MNPDRLSEVEGVARAILSSHFAIADAKLAHKKAGFTNYVFEVATDRALMVLRIGPREAKELAFTRERCVIERVREAGIPVPEVLVAGAGPHWDLSVALHALTVDQKEAFLEAYGLSAEATREFAPVWRLFNALNYVPHLERLLSENDQDAVERVRNRFSGALDLYAA